MNMASRSNNTIKYFILLLAIFLFACDKDEPELEEEIICLPEAGDVLYPLATGSYWIFEAVDWGDGELQDWRDTSKIAIEMFTAQHGGMEYDVGIQSKYYPQNNSTAYEVKQLYWNGPDGLYHMGGMAPNDTLIEPRLFLQYPVEVGDSWMSPRLVYQSNNSQFAYYDSLAIQFRCVAVDEPFETPLGVFNCVVYAYTVDQGYDVQNSSHFFSYYAPGIGYVGGERYSSYADIYYWDQRDIMELRNRFYLVDYCLREQE